MKALVLQVRYLTGRCVSTAYNDRGTAEWPPHPARIYSALVATWADNESADPKDQQALEWLATLEAPSIYATDASRRQVVPHFVPVNDVSVLGSFDRERSKLAKLERELDDGRAELRAANTSGDKKAIDRANKALVKAEKSVETERQKLQKAMAADQQPYPDRKHPSAGLASVWELIPDHRGKSGGKQPRSFPSVSPDDPRVFFRWTGAADEVDEHSPALSGLARRVVRVGHSASLVACTIVDDCPTPTWEPSESGHDVMRVPGPGQFAYLVEAFERHQEVEPRVLPCRFRRYRNVGRQPLASEPTVRSLFGDDWIVFRQMNGRRLSQTVCVELARAMRGALMKHADDPLPALLSGHTDDGKPSEQPHLAIIPLPFVGHLHATGEVLGVALVFPRGADTAQREAVLRALGAWEAERRVEDIDELIDVPPLALRLGRAGVIEVERVEWGVAPQKTLRAATWCRPSRAWVTATPIALDRNPGDLFSRDDDKARAAYEAAAESIATSCERIGLPKPSYVQVHPSVPLNGATKARGYPAFPAERAKHQRVKVHARIEFPVHVAGPVLLGAGRYYGLGLCFPQPREAEAQP
jgi:CRISPR-associated protein Csb2